MNRHHSHKTTFCTLPSVTNNFPSYFFLFNIRETRSCRKYGFRELSTGRDKSVKITRERERETLTLVLWEADCERALSDFLGEEILLVEEEDDGGVHEPFVVADGVEELHALHHSVHLLVLCQDQVVAGQRDAEDDGRDSFEAMDPLLALRPLAAHIKHSGKKVEIKFMKLARTMHFSDT